VDEILFVEPVIDTTRPGWDVQSPTCRHRIVFTAINVDGGREPFFYCSACNNIALRAEDAHLASKQANDYGLIDKSSIEEIYRNIESRIPPCPCGGVFRLRNTPKCPRCGTPIPLEQGEARLYESKISWIKGAILFRGREAQSFRLVGVEPAQG
jgi:hypothetical protein